MPRSLQVALPPMELNPVDSHRRTPATAGRVGQTPTPQSQSPSIAMTQIVKDALIRHFGSLKAAAITMQMDQGQLTRELQSGDFKLKKLDIDPDAKAFVSLMLYEAFAPVDQKTRVQRLIREGRRILDELSEAVGE